MFLNTHSCAGKHHKQEEERTEERPLKVVDEKEAINFKISPRGTLPLIFGMLRVSPSACRETGLWILMRKKRKRDENDRLDLLTRS